MRKCRVSDWLWELGACKAARESCGRATSLRALWARCVRGEWMHWLADETTGDGSWDDADDIYDIYCDTYHKAVCAGLAGTTADKRAANAILASYPEPPAYILESWHFFRDNWEADHAD